MKWNGIELYVGDKVRLTDKRPFYWMIDSIIKNKEIKL